MFRRSLFLLVFLAVSNADEGKPTPTPEQPKATVALTDRYGDPLPEGAIARFGTVRLRHDRLGSSVAYSPDGKMLAAPSGRDKTIITWDAATGRLLTQFQGHTDTVTSIAFSHDGKLLASASEDKTVRIWDVATQEEVQRFTGQAKFICVAFQPNSTVVAAKDDNRTVRLWQVPSAEQVAEFQGLGPLGQNQSLAFSRDGKYLFVPGPNRGHPYVGSVHRKGGAPIPGQ